MTRYLTITGLIHRLENGAEICGICGKDVTGQPDCVHNYSVLSHSTTTVNRENRRGPDNDECEDQIMRIGEEMLMYPKEEIAALPCLDRAHLRQVHRKWWGYE